MPRQSRRFVKVPSPTVHAGIGDALRHAFDMNGKARDFSPLQDLLDRLG